MSTVRFLAHITLEAQTPLKVGSNKSDFLQDSPVQRDWNGLPMILGTSIAGVLRRSFSEAERDEYFGFQKGEDGVGSRVMVSNALLLDENKNVNESLLIQKSDFLKIFEVLPIREHTAITSKGSAKDKSKFDEEVVYKGARFKFALELIDGGLSDAQWRNLLYIIKSDEFRLGGGSTKGFGGFKIVNIKSGVFNLDDPNERAKYTQNSSSLNDELHLIKLQEDNDNKPKPNYCRYFLKIKPDDFFIFGSGFGDDEADMTPVYEPIIDYKNGVLSEEQILIPASSIKGAISHRATYHYNKLNGFYIGSGKELSAVTELFGEAKESKDTENKKGVKGKLLFSDCYKTKSKEKVFDHVAIDRFTGGAIEGALFQEKTVADDREYEIEILLDKSVQDEKVIKAFENSLDDICNSMLSLGGATTKGHGIFSGSWSKQ